MFNKEFMLYAVIGVLTTAINIVAFWLLDYLKFSILVANTVAFIVAVLFAYWGNCVVVFKKNKTYGNFLGFWGMRLLTLVFDDAAMVFLTSMSFDKLMSKVFVNIAIIIFNYICSKYYIFK